MTPSSDRLPPDKLIKALNVAFDNFGPNLKSRFWNRLEKECGVSLEDVTAEDFPTMLEIEKAIRTIFGSSSDLILDWILAEIENERKENK